ncbi:hypothetical protein BYT27DRAFT_7223401 [Phlegmacium glaucopus]|nr:hypothetical protein BYT27DRAFT_7223401 [Phlegmacium glaucopus]
MACLSSPIPFISISPAPQEDPIVEPFSPFSALAAPQVQNGFRLSHLTPPPTITSFRRSFSPLHLVQAVGQGLESQQFQLLLAASKQKNVSGSNQSAEFRKEVAMNAHYNRHSRRRALFLSKLNAPPCPTAMMTPKTPPESPAIFHYSLPSPGLESPMTLFESWADDHANDVPHTWVERVDFRLVDEQPKPKLPLNRSSTKPTQGVPSLDQISARLIPRPAKLEDVKMVCDAPVNEDSPRPSIGIGRLRLPLRTRAIPQSDNQQAKSTPCKPTPPPLSLEPHAKTSVIPQSCLSTTSQLTESNLNSLNSRDQKASNMLFTLRKRTMSLEFRSTGVQEEEVPPKLRWRRSAPADMTPLQARSGFKHPVLTLSGGF